MRILTLTGLLFLVLAPSPLWAYGYEQNKDPILKVFKAVIYYGKASDWGRVQKEVDSIADRFEGDRYIYAPYHEIVLLGVDSHGL